MLKKIVLTGAAGRLGGYLRKPLAAKCETLVSTDIAPLTDPLIKGESFVQADLADYAKMSEIIKGADMVVHFGGHPDEKPFEDILHANIIGCYNIWQAAHEAEVRRIYMPALFMLLGCIQKQQLLISTPPIARTAITGWQNVLPRIWPSFTGIKRGWKRSVCGYYPVPMSPIAGHLAAGYPMMT